MKKANLIIIIILLLIISGLGGYIFYDKYHLEKNESTNSKESSNIEKSENKDKKPYFTVENEGNLIFDFGNGEDRTKQISICDTDTMLEVFLYQEEYYAVYTYSISNALSYFIDNFSKINWIKNDINIYQYEDKQNRAIFYKLEAKAEDIRKTKLIHVPGASDAKSELYMIYNDGTVKFGSFDGALVEFKTIDRLKKYNIYDVDHVCTHYNNNDICDKKGYVITNSDGVKIIEE